MRAILLVFLLAGCTTVPVTVPFPETPASLKQSCPDLQLVPVGTEKLSEVLSTVSKNYGQYHECQILVEAWQQWYKDQKEIYEKVK